MAETVFELTAKGKEAVAHMANGIASALANGPAQEAAPAPKKSSVLTGPVRVEHELYFTPQDRLLYENKQLEVRNALQAMALKKLEMAQARSTFENQLRALDQQLSTLTTDAKRREEELRALQTDIAETYSIDLQKIVYDSESGRISSLP